MAVETINVSTVSLPRRHLAYIRHTGPFMGDTSLFERLFNQVMEWAGPEGILNNSGVEAITVYHDNPDKVPPGRHRIDVGFTVPAGTQPEGDIHIMELPAGKYAIGSFEIYPDQYGEAWDETFHFIHEMDLSPAAGPMYESYRNDPDEHPEGKHLVDIGIYLRD